MPRGRSRSERTIQPAAPVAMVDDFAGLDAAMPTPDRREVDAIEAFAEHFEHHQFPQVNFRYMWVKDGKQYSIRVVSETTKPTEVTSEEYINGRNYNFVTLYRGGVMINTNDWRLEKNVQPDPGPTVRIEGVTGQRKTITLDEFLNLVNGNRAMKQQVI